MQKKNNRILVSVITLNYKEALLTEKCVQSLLQSKKINFEILVIDNSCSTDQAELVRRLKSKKVRVFIAEKNLGCAMGYNFGIQHSRGKYIFIINNDTIVRDQ